MSLRRRQPSTDDESKTMEQSVIIHEQSQLEELSTTKSMPHKPTHNKNPSKTKSLSPQLGPANAGRHSREVSVGNLIPDRYLKQAPSLIALLDVQKTPNASRPSSSRFKVPMGNITVSKSVPDPVYANGDNTPTLNSDVNFAFHSTLAPLQGPNDFDAPTTQINGDASAATVKLNKSRGSQEDIFANNSNGSIKYNNSEDNIEVVPSMQLEDNTTVQSMDSVVIHNGPNKADEYQSMIPTGDNDQMIDMQLLAVKAAEEFAILANENDKLFKENSTLKEQYDDMQHEKEKLQEELDVLKNRNQDEDEIIDDIDNLKSQAQKWELEKKLLMEQLAEAQNNPTKTRNGKDPLVGKTALKLRDDTSEDAQRLMMESLAKVTREKNELEQMMETEKNMKREYEKTISNLKKQLKDNEVDRQILSSNLDKQQKLYLSLKESHKKKELEIDNIVGRTRTLTMEEEQQVEKDKMELLEAVDEQKAYIEQLEAENQKLMATKIKNDDQMFMELKQLRTHRFARSMQLDAISNLAPSEYESHHSRGGSQSFSNYSNSGFAYFHSTNPSDAGLGLKAIRTQMNLFGMEDEDETQLINYSIKEEETKTDFDVDSDGADDKLNAPKEKKKVSFVDPKSGDKAKEKAEKLKEEKRRKRMEEQLKVNAEIEFFLMTCIAVKQNLCEEYPDKPEVMTENAMKLFEAAQKEHVVMSKFNLWIELQLRQKYDLPKLQGFKKFMEKHKVAEKFDKSKQKTKKLAKKTGQLVSAKTEEFVGRIRGLSKGGYNSDNEEDDGNKEYKQQDTLTEAKETTEAGKAKDVKIDIKETDDKKDGNTETKDGKDDGDKGDDNPPPNNNEQCCVIL